MSTPAPFSHTPATLDNYRTGNAAEYRQCKRCFMTGKACIYQHEIERTLRPFSPAGGSGSSGKSFMLMPFGSTLDAVYRDQIEPCIASKNLSVTRADDVMRTGFVVCEKICKQIQESEIISAEVSTNNSNVFYELGLAYALDKPIALFVQEALSALRQDTFQKLRMVGFANAYAPFDMITPASVKIWQTNTSTPEVQQKDDIVILLANRRDHSETVNGQAMSYTTDQICRGAMTRAITDFRTKTDSLWRNTKTNIITVTPSGYQHNKRDISAENVERLIRESRCVIICTDEGEPCSYFWMGFAHGLEKDVIPVTAIVEFSKEAVSDGRVTSLPFDVRALWHIYFRIKEPAELEGQLHGILEILSNKDKDTKHRRRFWDQILQGGSASIFVGSVDHIQRSHRHVVGEWDYRTVSELSGFFSSLKETMETVIQTPIFQASATLTGPADAERRSKEGLRLQRLLYERDSIIIASADVNDMTEVALATYAGIEPFQIDKYSANPDFEGIVGFKHEDVVTFKTPSVYFRRYNSDQLSSEDVRGFDDYRGGAPSDHPGLTRFSSSLVPYDGRTDLGFSVLYGHIAKFRLPEKMVDGTTMTPKWAIVIQGISGAATLGAAQALTGAKYKQFTVFGEAAKPGDIELLRNIANEFPKDAPALAKFFASPAGASGSYPDIEQHSEDMTSAIAAEMNEGESIECIVSVFVKDGGDKTHDERKIIWWDFALPPRLMPKPMRRRRS